MHSFALPATNVKQQVFGSPQAPKFEKLQKLTLLLFFIFRNLKAFESNLFLLSLSSESEKLESKRIAFETSEVDKHLKANALPDLFRFWSWQILKSKRFACFLLFFLFIAAQQ